MKCIMHNILVAQLRLIFLRNMCLQIWEIDAFELILGLVTSLYDLVLVWFEKYFAKYFEFDGNDDKWNT